MMNRHALFRNILTSGIKLSDPESIRKLKIFNVFQLSVIMMAPFLGLFFFYIGAIRLFYVTILAGLLMIFCLLVLRKTKNVVVAGNYAILILWAALLIISWNTGAITYEGVINPSWLLNAGLILLAIFLMGYLWGTIWTTIIFVETGVMVYLYLGRYEFSNLIPYELSAIYHLGTFLVALLMVLLFAFLFEKEKEEALLRERGKSRALRESRKYIDDILERSPVPTFILDRSHRVVQWNLACHEISGVPAREVLGKGVWDGFSIGENGSLADIILDDLNSIEKNYGDSMVSKTESGWFELEMYLPKLKEGKRTLINAAQILDDDGGLRGAIQTIQEIKTPRVEKAISGGGGSASLNEAFVSPVFKIDAQGKITFWNYACEENFGYTSSEMVGKSAFELLAKRYRPLFKQTVAKALQGGASGSKTLRYVHRKGKPLYVLARTYAVEADDGKGRECVIVNTDITNLRLRLKRLEVDAAESKEKLKTLSEEHNLLKKNLATFIRKRDASKDGNQDGS